MELRHQHKLIKLIDYSVVKECLRLLILSALVGIYCTQEMQITKRVLYFEGEEAFILHDPAPIKVEFKGDLSFLSSDLIFNNYINRYNKSKKLTKAELLEKKLIKLLPYNIRYKAAYYLKPIIEVSHYYGIDPLWAISIVWTESHFKVHSRSNVGAQGLMQLMPKTKVYLEKRIKRLRKDFRFSNSQIEIPHSREFYNSQLRNIEIGVHYLSKLLRRFRKRNLATVAYNMGPTWTRRRLNRRKPVGTRNIYLDKVSRSYKYISKRL